MASARPLMGRTEKPSKQVFDGFSYFFEFFLVEDGYVFIQPFSVNESDLRNNYRRFSVADFAYRHMVTITLF